MGLVKVMGNSSKNIRSLFIVRFHASHNFLIGVTCFFILHQKIQGINLTPLIASGTG